MLSNLQPNGLETFRKISYFRRQRGGHIKWLKGRLCDISNPVPPWWEAHRLGLTGSQRPTYRSESSEPHIKLSRVGIWHWEKEPLEHLALKASGACAQELHRTGGNGDPILKRRTHGLSRALDPRAEQGLHRNLGQT